MRLASPLDSHVDQLDLAKSALDSFLAMYPGTPPLEIRKHLGTMGMGGPEALQKMGAPSTPQVAVLPPPQRTAGLRGGWVGGGGVPLKVPLRPLAEPSTKTLTGGLSQSPPEPWRRRALGTCRGAAKGQGPIVEAAVPP